MSYCIHQLPWLLHHNYVLLGFYAFQSVFFANIYNKYVIHSSYFMSGFGAGNKMIDTYVILAMPFNFILSSSHIYYPVFIMSIMAMPLNMSLAM